MPTPVKLGLAGGPLVVAILIGRFGHKLHLVTYTTQSANLMIREIGIVLFLASVGIEAGANFVDTVIHGDGLLYVGCGFLITIIPLLIIGVIARSYYKINYFMLMGLIAGSNTDPPALAYSNQATGSDAPAVGYSTVYPLSTYFSPYPCGTNDIVANDVITIHPDTAMASYHVFIYIVIGHFYMVTASITKPVSSPQILL